MPTLSDGSAAPIFFSAPVVGSLTATVDVRPIDHVSIKLEYRRDQAASEMYFEGPVAGDGVGEAYVPTSKSQNTLTISAMGWF